MNQTVSVKYKSEKLLKIKAAVASLVFYFTWLANTTKFGQLINSNSNTEMTESAADKAYNRKNVYFLFLMPDCLKLKDAEAN